MSQTERTLVSGDTKKISMKDSDEQRDQTRRRQKEKKTERQREAGGWRTWFLNCFACGTTNQDEIEEERSEAKKTTRTEEETTRTQQASMERLEKKCRDDRTRKKRLRLMLRSMKVMRVNQEWNTLPMRSEDAQTQKVTFRKDLTDVWKFDREPRPNQRAVEWHKMTEEIRKEIRRPLEEELSKEEKLLQDRKEGQLALLKKKAAVIRSDDRWFLTFGLAIMAILCFCSTWVF